MTNMQLAFSEYLENARHHKVEEETSRRDVDEKIRHDKMSEQLTANQTAVQKYLGELQNETKRQEILTNAELQKLKISTDKAIAEAKQYLSEREYDNLVRKTNAEIEKLSANTAESVASAARIEKMTDAEYKRALAQANNLNSRTYGKLSGLVGVTIGKIDAEVDEAYNKAKPARNAILNVAANKIIDTAANSAQQGVATAKAIVKGKGKDKAKKAGDVFSGKADQPGKPGKSLYD